MKEPVMAVLYLLLQLTFVLPVVRLPATTPDVQPEHSLAVVAQYEMPMNAAQDVRWADDRSVLIADLERGIGQVTLPASGKATVAWLPEWPPPTGRDTLVHHLALSGDRIAAAGMVFTLRWHERQGQASGQMAVYYITDLDLNGDRLLVSGLRFDAAGKFAGDGAMTWLGSLSAGEEGLKPILPFRDQEEIRRCTGFGLGVVRFLHDGSFIIVPGTEPDVFLFGRDGKLQRTWRTDALGIEARCGLDKEQSRALFANPVGRQEWVNRRAIVDEVVDTPDGPGLIIRTLKNGIPMWEMVVLNGDGSTRFTLPFSSADPFAHVTSDTRGRRTIFLTVDRLVGRGDKITSRLIVMEWSEH
jgi:hypothetical protein